MDYAKFANKHHITMTLRSAEDNPAIDYDPHRRSTMHHYAVRLYCVERDTEMSCLFSTGSGWAKEPDVATVLSALASDAALLENSDLPIDDGGDEEYSRQVQEAVKRQTAQLKQFLGPLYEELVYG